jgi:hypothetical protein
VNVNITQEQAMNAQRGSRSIAIFFNLGAIKRWMVNATSRPLYILGEKPSTHCTAVWMGLGAGLD